MGLRVVCHLKLVYHLFPGLPVMFLPRGTWELKSWDANPWPRGGLLYPRPIADTGREALSLIWLSQDCCLSYEPIKYTP